MLAIPCYFNLVSLNNSGGKLCLLPLIWLIVFPLDPWTTRVPFGSSCNTTYLPLFPPLCPQRFLGAWPIHLHQHCHDMLDPQALKCIFLGYSNTQKGYKCYHPSTRKFFFSMDVTFHEDALFSFSPQPQLQGKHYCEDENLPLNTRLPSSPLSSQQPS